MNSSVVLKDQMTPKSRGPIPVYYESLLGYMNPIAAIAALWFFSSLRSARPFRPSAAKLGKDPERPLREKYYRGLNLNN